MMRGLHHLALCSFASAAAVLAPACAQSLQQTVDGADLAPSDAPDAPDPADLPAEDAAGEDDCPTGQRDCGDGCVDIRTNHDHCGACNDPCAAAEVCAGGVCLLECPTGTVSCDGSCVDLMEDAANCGSCGTACEAGLHAEPLCSLGICTVRCEPGWSDPDGDGSCDQNCVPSSSTEICNGVDDNCDGSVDEGFECVMGRDVGCTTVCGSTGRGLCNLECRPPAAAACTPPAEVCNGEDDDCSEGCDNGFDCCRGASEPCTTSCGTSSTRTCSALCEWSECMIPDETCNGEDDDCDDRCDNGFGCCRGETGPCTTSCGTAGQRTCSSSCSWGTCSPPAETLNFADDDCDGTIDEGFAVLARGYDDCNGSSGGCPAGYTARGSFKVDSVGCSASGTTASDYAGYSLKSGWMNLCSPTDDVVLAKGHDDCTGTGGGCPSGYSSRGSFKVDTVSCSGGVTGTAYDGATLRSGWMHLCTRSSNVSLLLGSDDCTGASGSCSSGTSEQGTWKPDSVACNPAFPSAVTTDGYSLNSGWLKFCVNN